VKPVKVEGVKEWEVEKILNKRKVRGVVKYSVQWKRFTAEHDSWKKEEDLENVKKSSSRIWEEGKCRSKTTREARYSREKRL